MKIILTIHAKKRMIERNIKMEDIREAIDFPNYTIIKGNKTEAYKKIGNKNLKIVYIKNKFIKIITLIKK